MTGMGMTVAAGVTSGGGPSALNITLSWSGGTTYSVSGASGTTAASFTYNVSGGTPPYSVYNEITNNISGKIGITSPTNPSGSGTFKATWDSFVVNETEVASFHVTVTDSAGGTDTNQYLNLGIKRTS